MNKQRNSARVGVGALALLAVLGLSLWAFAGDLRVNPLSPRILATASAQPGSSGGQVSIYVQFDGIPGECTDRSHQGWCPALSFSQEQTTSAKVSAGGAGGQATLKDVIVTKQFDKASPMLAQSVRQGKHIKAVRIDVVKANGGSLPYLTYELSNVLITGCRVTAGEGDQGRPLEQISLSFGEIKTTYTELDSHGAARPPIMTSFNVATNKAG